MFICFPKGCFNQPRGEGGNLTSALTPVHLEHGDEGKFKMIIRRHFIWVRSGSLGNFPPKKWWEALCYFKIQTGQSRMDPSQCWEGPRLFPPPLQMHLLYSHLQDTTFCQGYRWILPVLLIPYCPGRATAGLCSVGMILPGFGQCWGLSIRKMLETLILSPYRVQLSKGCGGN